jgi:hypothetical protein
MRAGLMPRNVRRSQLNMLGFATCDPRAPALKSASGDVGAHDFYHFLLG